MCWRVYVLDKCECFAARANDVLAARTEQYTEIAKDMPFLSRIRRF